MPKLTLESLLARPHEWFQLLSANYPVPLEYLDAHPELWDWQALSHNTTLSWTEAFIERHIKRLDGLMLTGNRALPWSPSFVEHQVQAQTFTWDQLRRSHAVFSDIELLALCLPHWNENARQYLRHDRDMGGYKHFPSDTWQIPPSDLYALVEQTPSMHWDLLSGVTSFPWSVEFIERHVSKLDWSRLSWNSGLPWSVELISRFESHWNWDMMNHAILWTSEMIDQFEDHLSWRSLSYPASALEPHVLWTDALLVEHRHKIHWIFPEDDHGCFSHFDGLINDATITWTPELFDSLQESIDTWVKTKLPAMVDEHEDMEEGQVYWTSWCSTSNWSQPFLLDMIARQKESALELLDWYSLASLGDVPWSLEFVQENPAVFAGMWLNANLPVETLVPHLQDQMEPSNWTHLSNNKAFYPSDAFIRSYAEHLNFRQISSRVVLNPELLRDFADQWQWEQIAQNPSLTYAMIQEHQARFSSVAWRKLSKHVAMIDAFEQGKLDASMPWTLKLLWNEHPFDLESNIPSSLFEALIQTQLKDNIEQRDADLEFAIAHSTEHLETYQNYATWMRKSDPKHAMLIEQMLCHEPESTEVKQAIAMYEMQLGLKAQKSVWRRGFLHTLYRPRFRTTLDFNRRAFFLLHSLSFATHNLSSSGVDDDLLAKVTSSLQHLERLNLGTAEITTLAGLGSLTKLRDLRLAHSAIAHPNELQGLTTLTHLNLWNTGISDLSPLGSLTNLEWLHIGHNPIADLSPLASLTKLTQLDLRFTQVKDLSPLYNLHNLREILVHATPKEKTVVTEKEVQALQNALPQVEVCDYRTYWRGRKSQDPFVV